MVMMSFIDSIGGVTLIFFKITGPTQDTNNPNFKSGGFFCLRKNETDGQTRTQTLAPRFLP